MSLVTHEGYYEGREKPRSGDLWTPNTLGSSRTRAVEEMSGKRDAPLDAEVTPVSGCVSEWKRTSPAL